MGAKPIPIKTKNDWNDIASSVKRSIATKAVKESGNNF